ncbi:hypothetical protein GCM10010278_83070 [Streptomyces melanogenes]|nr:hypothetical protein GCM10010278_83070 [Streptomyces melanogenes]
MSDEGSDARDPTVPTGAARMAAVQRLGMALLVVSRDRKQALLGRQPRIAGEVSPGRVQASSVLGIDLAWSTEGRTFGNSGS